MLVKIKSSAISGDIAAPASKSLMQRACAAALLSHGTSHLLNPGKSNDDKAILEVIQQLGAKVATNVDGSLSIDSKGVHPISSEIFCGESGLGLRMFTPIAALSNSEIIMNGSGSLLKRPMSFFDEVLAELGVKVTSNNGKLPIKIRGPLQPKNIIIDGSLSSQFLTGILMSYGASNIRDVTIEVHNLTSKPYIDLTLQIMNHFDVAVENNHYKQFYFCAGIPTFTPRTYAVESDWSSAAFLLVAGAIAGPLSITGLNLHSVQADKAILNALKNCGAEVQIKNDAIEVSPTELRGFNFHAADCPDLFPPLVALAIYCRGRTMISGVHRLQFKESNRAVSLVEEFSKMGVQIKIERDTMIIDGRHTPHGAIVHSHHDHRIAMACSVAALGAKGETTIEEAETVNKSYPDFFRDLLAVNAHINFD